MSESFLIAIIGLAGAMLGSLIGAFGSIAAAQFKSKSAEGVSTGCGVIGLSASVTAAIGLVIGLLFAAAIVQNLGLATTPKEPVIVVTATPAQRTIQPTLETNRQATQPPSVSSSVPTTSADSVGGYVPRTSEEAAQLFGGPPASQWKQCPSEPLGCWTFALPGTSFQVSVPANCLRPDLSIDGWKYQGGNPGAPDTYEGNVSIWKSLEAASIRCH